MAYPKPMQRWKLTIEYDGAPFVGWQRQEDGLSIQQCLEEAVAAFSGEERRVQGAGRTDSGVHALMQVAHLDLEKPARPDTVRDALNHHLRPNPIAILEAEPVATEFHARFSATGRAYLYRILNRRAPAALEYGRVWPVQRPLNADAMHEAAQILVGKHDFSSFRAAECQADSPVKTLDRLTVRRAGEEIHLEADARSFLHHQVRNIVGTLERVGAGRWTKAHVREALAAKDRRTAGPTAPPQGLYLTKVSYGTV